MASQYIPNISGILEQFGREVGQRLNVMFHLNGYQKMMCFEKGEIEHRERHLHGIHVLYHKALQKQRMEWVCGG